ncbi:MAG: WD40 repeat domain-containing serine/threonine protein kinase, partial [Pirellulales bacterium]
MSDDATREPADLQLREQVRACREAMARGLRSEVEQLLAAHPELRAELAGDLEAVPPAAGEPTIQGTVLQPTLTFASGREQPTKGAASLPSANMGATERIFGDYEIVEEIARGGMGVVYKARQRSLNRLVALKTVLKGDFASEAAMYRFRQEAEAAANLDHPNIVPIHEVGEQAGQQYFSMKLIDVPPGRGQKRGPAEAARLLAKVARAVHHAHERGILHRDLKPGNILIDRQGEPHVADFGLAKHLDAATSNAGEHATQTGAIVGTPAYMAPEQAQAEKSLTTAVDIYSLGAVLYAWLTGQPPFRGDDPVTTLMQVVSAEPRKPRSLDGGIDADLETICLKCLAKLPQQRYSTAAALADDLDRYLRGEPILARRASLGERLWRWSRRNPALAAASGLALAALVAVAVVGSSFAVYQSRAAAELREKQAQTDAALQESRLRASSLELDRCIAQCERGDISLGLLGMVQCLAMAPDDAADLHRVIRGNLAGWSRQLPVLAAPPFEHREAVRAVDFSGDGKVMLTAGLDRTARLWDTATGQPVREPWEHPDEVWCAAISADGQTVATGCHDGFARLWDVATCQPRGVPMKHDKRVNSVAFS